MKAVSLIPHLWILPILTVPFVVATIVLWVKQRGCKDYLVQSRYRFHALVSGCLALTTAAASVAYLSPFDSKFYYRYEITGTVDDVTNTIGSDSRSTPVVTLSGYDEPILMSNPRIVSLKGETVTLLCTYEWVPYGLDITNCEIAAIG